MYIYRVVGAQKASSASMGDGRWRNFLSCRGTMNQTFLLRDKDELNDSPHTFFISSSAKYASICIQTIFSDNGHNRWNKLLEQVANFLIWGTGTLVSVQHNKTIEQVMSKRPGAAENTHQRKMNKKKDKCITALTNKPTHWHAKKKGKMNALLYLAS